MDEIPVSVELQMINANGERKAKAQNLSVCFKHPVVPYWFHKISQLIGKTDANDQCGQ